MKEGWQSVWSEDELDLLGGVAAHIADHIVGEFGQTEDGDSWFVLEAPDGIAFAHFGKVERKYVLATSTPGGFYTDNNLISLVKKLLRETGRSETTDLPEFGD